MGCASVETDRSLVNDPQMNLTSGGAVSNLSPFSGLKSRDKITGGTSCSVCAH